MDYLYADVDPERAIDNLFFKSAKIPSRHGWYYFGIMTSRRFLGQANAGSAD
jgi:hypothetical protein